MRERERESEPNERTSSNAKRFAESAKWAPNNVRVIARVQERDGARLREINVLLSLALKDNNNNKHAHDKASVLKLISCSFGVLVFLSIYYI